MVLKFKCDRCGREITRDEAWNITMVPEAYAEDVKRRKLQAERKVQGELCRDCAEVIVGEMIYLKEVPTRDCRVASLLAMTEGEVDARDCRVASLLAMTEGEVDTQDCRVASLLAMTEGEVDTRDCRVASLLAMTEGEVIAETSQGGGGKKEEERAESKNPEGRYITVARKRAGWTIDQLADKLYVSRSALGYWERGRTKKIPWDDIERVLPEVTLIRQVGCEKFCPSPRCFNGGNCYFGGKGGTKR